MLLLYAASAVDESSGRGGKVVDATGIKREKRNE